MIDPAKTYRTRDGREVRIYAVDGGRDYHVHGAVKEAEGWQSRCWKSDGHWFGNQTIEDLVEIKPKHVWWVNFYKAKNSVVFGSRRAADCFEEGRIACIRVEFEEGEGL